MVPEAGSAKKRKKLAPGDPIGDGSQLHVSGEPDVHLGKSPSEWMSTTPVQAAPPVAPVPATTSVLNIPPPAAALPRPAPAPPRSDGKLSRAEKKKIAREQQRELIAKLDYLLPVRGISTMCSLCPYPLHLALLYS